MIHITPPAVAKFKELDGTATPFVRLSVEGRTCCGFRYGLAFDDEVDPECPVAEVDGVRLVTDPGTAEVCDGASIDYVETAEGAGFTVTSPDAPTGCVCGGRAAD